MSDPRALMEKQLGISIPKDVTVKVLEESPDTYYVVLPRMVREGGELSDADLEKVAGGKGVGDVLGTVGTAVGGAFGGPIGAGIGGMVGGGLGGMLDGGGGSSGGGGGAPAGGGGGGASCTATGSAVGTTIVDISL